MSITSPIREPDETLPDEGIGGPDHDAEAEADARVVAEVPTAGDELIVDRLAPAIDFSLAAVDDKECSLPVRQADLTRLLLAEPGLTDDDRDQLGRFGKILGATFHSEFYDRLCELKERYAPIDPDSEYLNLQEHSESVSDHSDEQFLDPFEAILRQANYQTLDIDVIKAAIEAPNEDGLTYVPNFALFEHLRVYARGYTQITREIRSVKTRFLKRRVTLDAYQRMIVAMKFKAGPSLGPFARSDVVYLRMFKDVPHVDMEMHLPEQGIRVKMRWIDKAQIASPLMMGIPTLAAKVLFASLILSPMAIAGLLLAPVMAGVKSLFGFQRAKQNHLYSMIYRLYYLTLANNSSVLTRVIDSAEDEEYKEAMLAYFFLWRGRPDGDPDPWTVHDLDARIEAFLMEKTGVALNFEVVDALRKLFRFSLARRDPSGHLHAVPLTEALRLLDHRWDNQFHYN